MRQSGRKTKYRISRVFVLLLVVTLAAGLLPPGTFAAETDGGMPMPDSETGTIRAYDWHRVNVVKDLPPAGTVCPVLILWQSNNTVYYATGGYVGQVDMGGRLADWDAVGSGSWSTGSGDLPNPFAGQPKDTMTFRTWEKMTTWEMEVTGRTDGDNNNAPVVRFYPYTNCMITGYDDFDFDAKTPVSYSKSIKNAYDLWTLYTSELGGDGASGLPSGMVRIFDNVPGTDTCFKEKNQYLVGWCWMPNASKYGNFVMYWGEERNLSAITDDYTIAEGQVMNVDDGVVLMDGKKLTIEPGGMLSIEGTFYNNGYIENRGTIILQENACVRSSPDVNDAAGKILCSGAKINRKDIAEEWIAVLQGQIDALNYDIDLRDNEVDMLKDSLVKLKGLADYAQTFIDKADYIRDQANLLAYQAEENEAEAKTKDAKALDNAKEAEELLKDADELQAEAGKLEKDAEKLLEEARKLREDAKKQRDESKKLLEEAEAEAKTEEAEKLQEDARKLQGEAAKLQEAGVKLQEEARKLLEDAKTLREDAEKKQAESEQKREEYYNATEFYQKEVTRYLTQYGIVEELKSEVEAMKSSVKTLEKDIEGYKKVPSELVSGDGNLVLLNGAKLALGDGKASGFRIEYGANVTCHGYIISPHTIQVEDAKLKIGKNGVLFCGYTYPAKDMNLPQLAPKNPGTLDVTFNNLTAVNCSKYSGEENALEMLLDYVFEVDGVYRYSNKGALAFTQTYGVVAADPNFGNGKWVHYEDPNYKPIGPPIPPPEE